MKCKRAKKGAATTVTLKLGTINPERASEKREVASLRGFDGAFAGASYDDNLCPGCGFDARFVSALVLRRAGGDAHGWTASVGYNNGRYPLTPLFCPGKTKVVGLRVAERPEKLEISPWISGIGVICDDV